MPHQVMFSGNIKKGNSPIISYDDAMRVHTHVSECDYTGFTIYADGNYITLYEGDLDRIQNSIDFYADSERYSKIMTMMSRPVTKREFEGFALCLRYKDCDNVFGSVKNCYPLTPAYLRGILPQSIPAEYRTLLRIFARVNNLNTLQSVA